MADESQTTDAVFARLHNACEPGTDYDDEDMTVRQGDVRVILEEVIRLRKEVEITQIILRSVK